MDANVATHQTEVSANTNKYKFVYYNYGVETNMPKIGESETYPLYTEPDCGRRMKPHYSITPAAPTDGSGFAAGTCVDWQSIETTINTKPRGMMIGKAEGTTVQLAFFWDGCA